MGKAHSNKQQSANRAHHCITYCTTELWNNSFNLIILSFQISNRQLASTTLRSVKPALWFNTCPWWRHQMEIFSALLAILCGELIGTGEFPAQRPMTRSFMFSLICACINGWVKNREAGDLRRHRAHYDVIVMLSDTYILCGYTVNISYLAVQ